MLAHRHGRAEAASESEHGVGASEGGEEEEGEAGVQGVIRAALPPLPLCVERGRGERERLCPHSNPRPKICACVWRLVRRCLAGGSGGVGGDNQLYLCLRSFCPRNGPITTARRWQALTSVFITDRSLLERELEAVGRGWIEGVLAWQPLEPVVQVHEAAEHKASGRPARGAYRECQDEYVEHPRKGESRVSKGRGHAQGAQGGSR